MGKKLERYGSPTANLMDLLLDKVNQSIAE